jgi:hypothetical protein
LLLSGVVEVGDDGETARGRWIIRDVAKGTKDGDGHKARCCNNFAIYEVRYWKAEGKWYFMRGGYLYMFL